MNCFWNPGQLEIVKYLIEKGANKEAKNRDGLTPLLSFCSIGN